MALIAIDITPVLPHGENGGAKLLALELIKGFQSLSTEHTYLLLTAWWNDDELSFLDSPRAKRLCVLQKPAEKATGRTPAITQIKRILGYPVSLWRQRFPVKMKPDDFLSARGVDLLFCPFTAPTYAEKGIPVVCVVADVQHKDYPQFFSAAERRARDFYLGEMQDRADTIICISESTRQSVLKHLQVDAARTQTIPVCIQSRLVNHDFPDLERHLAELKIDRRPFMFYPANFWPHKNHQTLLEAFASYITNHPESDMDLVFTGALSEPQQELQSRIKQIGLESRVHFLGYLPEDQLIAVWQGCAFLIFPSLYEGFGIPVLEAMQFGKPVLCSHATSLPEVAGDAALYFDPRQPEEIVQAMEKMAGNQDLACELVRRGRERLSHFQFRTMILDYLHVFEDVMRRRARQEGG